MESTSTVALLEAVKHNLGVTIVSQRMIDLLQPQNTLVKPIRNVSFERPFTLIHVKNKYISPGIAELIERFKDISLN
jgi:DNA-binding transcriptional LysR family regulator